MRWLVTGGRGMFGTDLVALLDSRGEQVRAVGSADLDIRDLAAVREAVTDADVVVNAAAWTAVDDAEQHEPEAFAVNAIGAHNLALATAGSGARLAHISTDYVFDGVATQPYAPDHPQDPRSAYGRTKAAGEWAVRAANPAALILRTAWLYGPHGPNFVATMLRLAGERDTLSVVDDQLGQPTSTAELARMTLELLDADAPGGYYHAAASGQTTWCGFARRIFELSGLDPDRVQPCTTADFPRPAPRPAYSVLGDGPGTNPTRTDWAQQLQSVLPEIGVSAPSA